MPAIGNPPETTPRDRHVGLRNRLSELDLPEPNRMASELQRIVLERLDQSKTN
ncbi:MAG: hypothetical protein ACXVQU_12495 [Actinomycetota bacterium]